MIIQTFVKMDGENFHCGICYIYSPGDLSRKYISISDTNINDGIEKMLNTILTDTPHRRYDSIGHILIVSDDKWKLRNSLNKDTINDIPLVFESYPYDFTPGSWSCKNIEHMIKAINDKGDKNNDTHTKNI